MIKYIVFDFDGTLADTFSQMAGIIVRLAKENGYPDSGFDEIKKLGARGMLKKYKIPLRKIPFYALKVQAELREKKDVRLFPEIIETLKKLQEKYRLGVVSSNSTEVIENVLTKHGARSFFDFIFSDHSLFGKHLVLKRMCKKFNLSPQEILYVADEDRDIAAARKAGIKIVSVSWGYNSAELLKKEGPDHLVDSPPQILDIV